MFLVLTYSKRETYDFVLVIVDFLTKTIYFTPIKVIIGTPNLAKVIIDMIVHHYIIFE